MMRIKLFGLFIAFALLALVRPRKCLEMLEAADRGATPTRAAEDVLAERSRQVNTEGWAPVRDDGYTEGELALAAACYAGQARIRYPTPGEPPPMWPWASTWWKPTDHRRNLVKAGALILAEIERLDRAQLAQECPLPPAGWRCTRRAGHDGPCAAGVK